MKTVYIADNVHGVIALTDLEKAVIRTPIFNRLHNVLQNSTVYFTYPSNRTSRLAHSLGTMHLAGEMFYRAVLNADRDTQERFLEDLFKEISAVPAMDSYAVADSLLPGCKPSEILESPLMPHDMDVVYQEHVPALPGSQKFPRAFLIGFQAIRLAGLLHDLGHPPFSHVAEAALTDLFEELALVVDSGERSLTHRETKFMDILTKIREKAPESDPKIHEGISLVLAQKILDESLRELIQPAPDNETRNLFFALSTNFAMRIFREETIFSLALHSIVASDFDADRLDFVARDSMASGVSGEPFRYDRLRNDLRLVYCYPGKKKTLKIPVVLPSVRSLADIERFFRIYQKLYRYVVFHHRVVRTDVLLCESIKEMARNYLREETPDKKLPSKTDIPKDISGLWRTLDPKNKEGSQSYADQFIQWDDSWLLTILRDHYFYSTRSSGKREELGPIETRLEEIVSNRRIYQSLYKGLEDFTEVDQAFLENLPADLDVRSYFSKVDEAPTEQTIYLSVVERYLNCTEKQEVEELRKRFGLLLGVIKLLLYQSNMVVFNQAMPFVNEAVDDLKAGPAGKYLTDILVASKVLKRGIESEDFLLHSRGSVVELSAVSRLKRELETNAIFFPPFFVFVTKKHKRVDNGLTEEELQKIRTELGKALALAFLKTVTAVESK